ncbi:uncharacterized protein PHACADRAFT_195663 [Phanerochaete carnosa HHB-10118-sp]|uniref:Uncharacterized protein n=1 Tax=Phanerochaete carnosa (strain HHB-10118-sp) TaxID=650164 RepID=K5W9H2_PHACS|nr:uncharacterized protein PHACADRAFT_195663 [Phanerochaete carnosa HHB-10118-sp]EKM55624.1 hypothetical protein PHACADRAFT_195663 [Phanerochaete carnosa HHB-10118-sp]
MSALNAAQDVAIRKVVAAMEDVYGPIGTLTPSQAQGWTPPPAPSGHLGRYLWTDAFGVLNFITLHRLTGSSTYLACAARLIDTVHSVLGKTRSQDKHLPGASPERPLAGGLRIGKDDESGSDGDGQYHHYLTIWMFALNRMTVAAGETKYNELAIQLARAIHPAFVVNRDSFTPRMRWKMSIDLSRPLVSSQGNLDPIDGYVVFSLLQKTAGDTTILKEEIQDYKKIVDMKWRYMESDDPLDLGMTLWSVHWMAKEEPWAAAIMERASENLRELTFVNRYFEYPLERRLAFREFGTCLGIKCASILSESQEENEDLVGLAENILDQWEGSETGDEKLNGVIKKQVLRPITKVMYATALVPGEIFYKAAMTYALLPVAVNMDKHAF